MATTDFDKGMEEAFKSFHASTGGSLTYEGNSAPATVDGFEQTSGVDERSGGRRTTLTAEVTMLTSDWVALGLKKGAVVTLEDGKAARIANEPAIPTSGYGSVAFRITES